MMRVLRSVTQNESEVWKAYFILQFHKAFWGISNTSFPKIPDNILLLNVLDGSISNMDCVTSYPEHMS